MENFDHFSNASMVFLKDLKAQNNREWFASNKGIYDQEIRAPAKSFAQETEIALEALTGIPHRSKIFRIHRDVRFSKDKTPYNTHIHLSFTPETGHANPPMWFFGQNTERLSLGCGVFQYDKPGLSRFRSAMAGTKGAALIALRDTLWNAGIRVSDPHLKRVPSGFDPDHPHKDALLRKGFSAWIDIDGTAFCTQPDLVARTVSEFGKLTAVFEFLSELAAD